MSTERPHQLDENIARYLHRHYLHLAYTLLYTYLEETAEDGVTNYSRAERRFDKDKNLGPNKRKTWLADTEKYLREQSSLFEDLITSESEATIFNSITGLNSVLFLMMLDQLLKDVVETSPVPLNEIYQVQGKSYYLLTHMYPANENIKARLLSGDLRLVVRWNHVVPSKLPQHKVEVHKADPIWYKEFAERIGNDSRTMSIYSAESHRVEIDYRVDKNSLRFLFVDYLHDADEGEVVEALLKADEQGASVVIFPELTVTEKLREDIKTWLAIEDHNLFLVIAGSWHVGINDSEFVNESIMLDSYGQVVLTHTKNTTFSFRPNPKSEVSLSEDIVTSNVFNLIMLPFGLSTLLICKDFCDLLSGVQETIKHCSPEFIFLPTMGDEATIKAHDDSYQKLSVSISPTLIFSNHTPRDAPGNENFAGRLYNRIHSIDMNREDKGSEGAIDQAKNIAVEGSGGVQKGLNKKEDLDKLISWVELPGDKTYRVKLKN